MIARRVGEPGFVVYLHELRGLRVLSRREVLAWLALHGAVIRWTSRRSMTDRGLMSKHSRISSASWGTHDALGSECPRKSLVRRSG